ncbi:MAG: SDR family oxidoreductase [Dehalococcoidales bacterium]|nr:SDR family oxidoreductase [Dehalococcoidales bacterium]
MSLEGKVALVTGAASKRGMGRAIALRLAREGADVVVADKFTAPKSMFPGDEDWGGLDAEVEEIKALGRNGMAVVMDINSGQEVDDTYAKILDKFGKIDILVHCAAVRGPVGLPLVDHTEEHWRKVMDVNVIGSFLVCKGAAKAMIDRGEGGRIVVFASMAGTHGVIGSSAYCASKHATIGLVKTLALELGQYKINVNAINPGVIITNLRDEAFDKMAKEQGVSWEEAQQADYKKMSAMIPLGRMGTVEDIAKMTHFLVSDQSVYISGEMIGVNGAFL